MGRVDDDSPLLVNRYFRAMFRYRPLNMSYWRTLWLHAFPSPRLPVI